MGNEQETLKQPAQRVAPLTSRAERRVSRRAQRAERGVDDACVRARREHTDAAAAHARREESLVEDQGIRHSVPVAHRVVPDEPRLVRRHALDLAADEEEARKCVRLGVLRDAPTWLCRSYKAAC